MNIKREPVAPAHDLIPELGGIMEKPELNFVETIPEHFWLCLAESMHKDPIERTWMTLCMEPFTLYLIRWPLGARTPIHDHVDSKAHIHFVRGTIKEDRYTVEDWNSLEKRFSIVPCKKTTQFFCHPCNDSKEEADIGARYIHAFEGASSEPALTLHAYMPKLKAMGYYKYFDDGSIVRTGQWTL